MNSDEIVTRSTRKKRGFAARTKLFLWAILLLVLLACALADRRDGDAYAGSYGGSGEDEQLRRRAATKCRDYAQRQRLNVQRVLSSQSLGSGNDYEVHLRVQRRGRSDDVTCYTDVRTGSTRIVEGGSYGGSGEDEQLRRRAATTCRNYAEKQRLNVQRVLSSQSLGAGNDYEVHLRVQRRGRSDDVTCYTDVRTGSTRIAD